jgi:hypothetical protein
MSTNSEGINKEPSNQSLCTFVMRLMIFLFDSHQMARLPLMELVNITGKNKRTTWTPNKNSCYFKYRTLFSTTLPNLTNLTHRQLLEETFIQPCYFSFSATDCHEQASLFPSIYRKFNIEKCVLIYMHSFKIKLFGILNRLKNRIL